MKKKTDRAVVIIVIATILVLGYLIFFNIRKNNKVEINATIKETGSNYVIAVDDKNNEYLLNTNNDYKVGDKINFVLKNIKKDSPITGDVIKIDTISKEIVFSISDELEDTTEENSNNTSNSSNTPPSNEQKQPNNNTNNNNNNSTQTKDTNTSDNSEANIVNYFTNFSNEIDNTDNLKSSIKEKFILIVDFLFYDEPINSITFKELTTTTKLKILSLFLKIDHKIEEKFPNYKNTISNKGNKVYTNSKNKAIELYFDITTNVCQNDQELCDTAKEGLRDLKKNFSLTWEFIKEMSNTGISKLKNWYEIWREI